MSNILLRPATRADTNAITTITNAANATSHLHRLIAPGQDTHPYDYRAWRRNIVRSRFVTANTRTIVAVDTSDSTSGEGEVVGVATWAAEPASSLTPEPGNQDPDSGNGLYAKWISSFEASEASFLDGLERILLSLEQRFIPHPSINKTFLTSFLDAFLFHPHPRPTQVLHCHLMAVAPSAQGRGIGRVLLDWGKEVAQSEGVPVFLEATLEATGFYEKAGFRRLCEDVVVRGEKGKVEVRLPVYVWEGRGREGRWLELEMNGDGDRRRWREVHISR